MAGNNGRTGRIPTEWDRNSVNAIRPSTSKEQQLINTRGGRLKTSAERLDANMARWIGWEPVDRNSVQCSGRAASRKPAEMTPSGSYSGKLR